MNKFSFRLRRFVYLFIGLAVVLTVARYILHGDTDYPIDRAAQLNEINKAILSARHIGSWRGQVCKHPTLDVKSPDIMKFVEDTGRIECSGEKDWVEINGNVAVITQEAKDLHGDIECSFTDIIRSSDFATQVGLTTKTHTEYSLETSDFVKIDCFGNSGKRWSNIMAGARFDQDIFDRTGWNLLPKEATHLNVLMFGFDSISRNTFIRKLPKSYQFMKKELGTVILEGYNIVGDGTPQALIPILTGKTELELPDTRRRMGNKATYVNAYPFIWNDFRNNGYVTGYLEDTPSTGIFTYRLKGFDAVPTDHYMRPYYIEAENEFSKFSRYCMGSMPRHVVMLNYIKHLYQVYKDRPKFIFGFHGELSHDNYNLVGGADDDLRDWLEWFKMSGYLNNTLLVVMSDHGHRFAAIRNTQQGKLEERLPFFSFTFPPWFEKSYPEAMNNLKLNVKRLSTPFDVHATFVHLLNTTGGFNKGDLNHRGISLLNEIPIRRTCTDAYIEPHWCACLDWEVVDRHDPIAQRAARSFVDFINRRNSEFTDECAHSELSYVVSAARLEPTGALRRFHSSKDRDGFVPNMSANTPVSWVIYQIKLVTNPGHAIFEVSLKHDISQDSFVVKVEDVSRVNQYGAQAKCVEKNLEHLRKFCYCRNSQ